MSCYQDLIDLLRYTSVVKNLYMFIDGLHFWMYFQEVSHLIPVWSDEIGQEIVAIRVEQRWKKCSKEYLDEFTHQFKPIKHFFLCFSEFSELVCPKKFPLSSNRSVSVPKLFTEPQFVDFNLSERVMKKGKTSSFSIKSTPLIVLGFNESTHEIIFEFLPKNASDFKAISSSGETIHP